MILFRFSVSYEHNHGCLDFMLESFYVTHTNEKR